MPIVGIDLTQPGVARGIADGAALSLVGYGVRRAFGSKGNIMRPAPPGSALVSSVLYDYSLASAVEGGMGEYAGAAAKGAVVGALSAGVDAVLGTLWYKEASALSLRQLLNPAVILPIVASRAAVSAALLPAGRFVGDVAPPILGMSPLFQNGVAKLAVAGEGAGAAALQANAVAYPLSAKP